MKLLALQPDRRLLRDQVMDALWPDLPPDEAARRLHVAAHHARGALDSRDGVVLSNGTVSLFPTAELTVDVDEFELAADAARADDGPEAAGEAVAHYAGILLPEDLYEPWAEEPRERLRRRHLELLRAAGRYDELVAADPLDEDAQLALVRDHVRKGRRQSALRALDRMTELFRRELGVAPGPEAVALRAAAEALPLGSSAHAPLPGPRNRLIGRAADLEDVAALLGTHRVVTITGPGGAGKSTLALAVARDVQAAGRRGGHRHRRRAGRARTGPRRTGGHPHRRRGRRRPGRGCGPDAHARGQPGTTGGASRPGQLRAPPRRRRRPGRRRPRRGPAGARPGDQSGAAARRRRGRAPDRVPRPGVRPSSSSSGPWLRQDRAWSRPTTPGSWTCASGSTGCRSRSSSPPPSSPPEPVRARRPPGRPAHPAGRRTTARRTAALRPHRHHRVELPAAVPGRAGRLRPPRGVPGDLRPGGRARGHGRPRHRPRHPPGRRPGRQEPARARRRDRALPAAGDHPAVRRTSPRRVRAAGGSRRAAAPARGRAGHDHAPGPDLAVRLHGRPEPRRPGERPAGLRVEPRARRPHRRRRRGARDQHPVAQRRLLRGGPALGDRAARPGAPAPRPALDAGPRRRRRARLGRPPADARGHRGGRHAARGPGRAGRWR